ncbi:PstS family phosphate ABC transporter substrate-binding protein [Iningainema tapete]|uniref:Phosphate-binding protein n=1 Tax=Iningainema tapete BLCC-T55 TaxID=2748662 RepID=A0A8J6XED3_9CYAN|nr:PstS family phosphate ABC transporter substrate-binding protein [Iningainema tapete]MBD2774860.1 PstS family phosphate ABC transporter substrate-binding protein [Iningainema tapete BLCC-T55]
MDATLVKLALVLGVLAWTTSCTTTPSSSTKTQKLQNVSYVTSGERIAQTAVVTVDGSSTVYPITQAIAKQYQSQQNKSAQVRVSFSGTTGGFEKFCAGKTDINNASRPILKNEMEACKKNGIGYIEIPVAFDALTITVNPQNNWAKDVTVAELKKMWEPAAQGKITRWKQVRSSWPDRPLKLYGAGDKSGTFDYFTEAIVGQSKASRKDYTGSEDDDVLVAGISKDTDALGYFGHAYYEAHQNQLKALAVDNGKGAVTPTRQNVEKSQYQPLSRPLFVYVNPWSAEHKATVYEFVNYYIDVAPKVVNSVGYIPLPDQAYKIAHVHLNRGKVGTVFGGRAALDLTIGELLRKQKQY